MIIKRKEHGLGDWIMAVTAAYQVGLAHKHLVPTEFACNTTDKPHFNLVVEYVVSCGYNIRFNSPYIDIENIAYPKISTLGNEKRHLIQIMMDQITDHFEVNSVKYSPNRKPSLKSSSDLDLPDKYIAFNPSPKNGGPQRPKDAKWEDWEMWVNSVKRYEDIELIQIGSAKDQKMPGVIHHLGGTLDDAVRILSHAEAFHSTVGGLMHLAGHLGTPCHTYYCGPERPELTWYPRQIPTMI